MIGQVNFNDIAILCNRPNNSCQQNLKCFDKPLFSLGLFLVCEIPRSFERSSLSTSRTQGSFIHINSGKIFERDLVSSDSVAKSATQEPLVF